LPTQKREPLAMRTVMGVSAAVTRKFFSASVKGRGVAGGLGRRRLGDG